MLIASALWGVVRPGRPDPGLPALDLGAAAADRGAGEYWRPALAKALPDEGLVVDLRSGGYAAAWTPEPPPWSACAASPSRTASKVISHFVKAIRGDVARALLQAPEPPRTPEDVAEIAAAAGHEVELTPARAST